MRNNERINAVNDILVDLIDKYIYKILLKDHPKWWFPVFDIFSQTHAAFEFSSQDAAHSYMDFRRRAVRVLMHFIQHAPNFQEQA